ncbi:inosine monophosphate dehydrogenase [Lojkania enalia]|uniref:Inosine monophosphate dehydrogenase n=1 Tax=Lojkania enalia TaxID=147567 RepID=A0A9P4N1R8_9PLEO|nr:inosine monophosphate dehydrogenase [Didymosphaeria enalia]
MDLIQRLKSDYPWIQTPLVVSAPMRLIALAELAVGVSGAGGIGFIGAGTDVSDLEKHFEHASDLLARSSSPPKSSSEVLPIGVGFINWGAQLDQAIGIIKKYKPAAVWFFAPSSKQSLKEWSERSREACPEAKIWVQVGSVREAHLALEIRPNVLVVQGTDAGGHGLAQGAGLISLLPEVNDAVQEKIEKEGCEAPIIIAAGGIVEGRSAAAALALGASGVVMGTRFLASKEANIAKGYQDEILRAADGGQSTVRTKVYDNLRGTTGWAESHNARGVINRSYTDNLAGMGEAENKRLYEEEIKKGDEGWGVEARMTTYAGTGIGLVKEVKGVKEIVEEVRKGVKSALNELKV